ncbi:putative uncharacterized protein [Bacillus thuringiensis serovar tolworthi]|uniref:Uncharacterized protein n=1 Tax=Bacillus thuringiensis subsp. tolworthi TaxID=1442 RepID=A0A9W4ESR5_BACTO|nr:putative uncharacterized protein [Bacillus thuringiensis serovar tolworthi]
MLVCLDAEETLEEHADKININNAVEIITENFLNIVILPLICKIIQLSITDTVYLILSYFVDIKRAE